MWSRMSRMTDKGEGKRRKAKMSFRRELGRVGSTRQQARVNRSMECCLCTGWLIQYRAATGGTVSIHGKSAVV
jgi:hypothetical protein